MLDLSAEPIARDAVRILLIEDEPSIARLTALVLRTEGYTVDHCLTQSRALLMLAGRTYDVVLADTDCGARTTSLDGLAPVVAAAGSAPVLLFSAHRFARADVSAAGLAGAIRKPFDVDELLKAVARVVPAGQPVASRESDSPVSNAQV